MRSFNHLDKPGRTKEYRWGRRERKRGRENQKNKKGYTNNYTQTGGEKAVKKSSFSTHLFSIIQQRKVENSVHIHVLFVFFNPEGMSTHCSYQKHTCTDPVSTDVHAVCYANQSKGVSSLPSLHTVKKSM